MSVDYNSSMPIRSQADGTDEHVLIKIKDGSSPSNGNAVSVDSDKAMKTLATGHDPSGASQAIRTSQAGNLSLNGVYNAATNTEPSSAALVGHARSATPGNAQAGLRQTGVQSGNTISLDISLHDENGNAYSVGNPLPVSLEESKANRIADYLDSNSVAPGSAVNHDYSVPAGKNFDIHQLVASASGKIRVECQFSLDGTTFVSKAVLFNSTSNPNVQLQLAKPLTVTAGATAATIRLIRKNLDNQAMDIYSTLVGDIF